ncbi:MAG: glycosyltransferase family 4 protein [Candidatus Bathyarchaeia archaeon]
MKILITRREQLDVPDGINTSIFYLGKSFREMGHKVAYLSTYFINIDALARFYDIEGFEFKSIFDRTTKFPSKLWKVFLGWFLLGRRIIKTWKPDYVIMNGAIPFLDLHCPHVFVSHDLEHRMVRSRYFQNLIKKISYKSGFAIVATTSEIKEGLVKELGIHAERVFVIPTCIDISTYRNRPRSERSKLILHIGTAEYKNPILSLEAFQLLEDSLVELAIIGKPSDKLRNAISTIPTRLKTRIHLLGNVSDSDFKELLAEAMILSVPSVYKFPVLSPTVLEGMASGTPVVTTPSISCDIAIDGISCLVREPNPTSFAQCFQDLFSDENLWKKLSEGGLIMAAKFDRLEVARQYLELYEKFN